MKDNTCEGVVKDSWGDDSVVGSAWSFIKKIYTCQDNLREWSQKSFGHVRNLLQKKLADLKTMEESYGYRQNPIRLQALREEIQQLKTEGELMWKQRSRNSWLKEGDSNTKYFHCRANQRNRRNHILGIEDEDGVWIEEEAAMGKVIERYFEGIFTSSNPSSFEEILDGVLHIVTAEDNVGASGDFHADEVL